MGRRRGFLRAVGAAAIATLAGCSSGSDDAHGDDAGRTDGGEEGDGTGEEYEDPVQATVDIDGDGTDAVDVMFTSANNADGLAVVDASGTVVGDGLLEDVGATEEIDESGSYAVYGYLGSPTDGEELDSQAEATALLAAFEVE